MKNTKPSLVSIVVIKDTPDGPKTLFIRRVGKLLFGCWQYVTGGIEPGETAIEAAFRELFEETKLTPTRMYLGDFVESFYDDKGDTIQHAPLFIVYVDEKQKISLSPKEHDQYEWITLNEAKDRCQYTNQKEVVDHVKKVFIVNEPSDRLIISLRRHRTPTLTTERLALYPLQEDDINDLYPLLSHPEVMRFSITGQKTFEEVKKVIEDSILAYKEKGLGLYSIVLKETQQFIGYLGLFTALVDNEPYLEFKYRLFQSVWNRGYAKEATRALLSSFRNLKEPIFSSIEKENLFSVKVAKGLGGVFDKEIYHQDKVLHRYRYNLTSQK
jgi:RimJ/RimL family protein N-acetyltransferase/8-oxo-dGTP pyrophosphatase MutT (NUDIX family)